MTHTTLGHLAIVTKNTRRSHPLVEIRSITNRILQVFNREDKSLEPVGHVTLMTYVQNVDRVNGLETVDNLDVPWLLVKRGKVNVVVEIFL